MAALRHIFGSVTQGGADAFAQDTIATALEGSTGIAYRIRELEFEVPRWQNILNASDVTLCLTRRTKSAMPLITDVDVIKKVQRQVSFNTSGAVATDGVFRFVYTEDENLLVVEDPLYLQIDSSATTLTQTGYCRIGYEQVKISDIDRLTLLTQSLV